ncbi:MAG TPA: TIGR02453 family protein [Candidatus Elarobacter sp.]|jgi:uncharacterized protein (TIGR02453 family)|nr:TIGR02453 family protein [Candidatus Elarobacter sp.]
MARRTEPLDLAVAFRFLRGLKRNNDRTWFHANRAAWDDHVRHGFEDLVTMLLLAGAQADDRLAHVDPRACLFRIANDTRFHKQKNPYKTWLSAWMSPGGKNGAYPGYYVHLAPGASHVSAGVWVPDKPSLHALRTTFAEDGADARAFDRILASRAIHPYLPLETHALRVTPRGFAKSHPRLPLIRARNYMLSRDVPDAELQRRGAFAVFRDFIRDTAPFVRWLDAHAAHERDAGDPFGFEE